MFSTLSKPYAIAGQTISETATLTYKTLSSLAIATYETLTLEKAQRIYRDAWTIISVVVQVTALAIYAAGLYAIIAGRKFRNYYEAEWAADVERFLSYPDRCIEQVSETMAAATAETEEAQPTIPAAVQTILDSNAKTTKKLRAIATHFGICWRNAHGEGKHLRNDEIKAVLSDHPEILAAL
jgi:hypothetical protein